MILVTGFDAERVAAAARAFAERTGAGGRLSLVHAAGHAQGLSASLRAGLAAVPPEAEGAFVFLADMPRVPAALAGRLAEAIGARLAAAPAFEGRRGHPVLLRRALFDRLAALEGDRGAGAVLAGLGEDLALVETDDPGVVFDVDAPEDLPGPGSPQANFWASARQRRTTSRTVLASRSARIFTADAAEIRLRSARDEQGLSHDCRALSRGL